MKTAGFPNRPSKRVLDLLDCSVLEVCKKRNLGFFGTLWTSTVTDKKFASAVAFQTLPESSNPRRKTLKQVQPELNGKLLDYSQSHLRKPITGDNGISRCLTTSSRLFFFEQQRNLQPIEHLMLQGYEKDVKLPIGFSANDVRRVAGEGIALPCLGTLLWALRLTKELD